MLVRALILWLVMLNLATAGWWWMRAGSVGATATGAAQAGPATVPGLELVRPSNPTAAMRVAPPDPGLPPCPEADPDVATTASDGTAVATMAPQDCAPLR